MNKERSVFLFGAGATRPWNSPPTSELTSLILESGFEITGSKKTITRFIYDTLLANGFQQDQVNFETLINVVEELIVYYGRFNYLEFDINRLPSLVSCIFTARFEKQLLNYSVKDGEIKHGYQLQIPANVDYSHAKNSNQNEPPSQFFFQHLLAVLLTDINARISEYSYHTDNHSKINHDSINSVLFINWMQQLKSNTILRLYTLNYERIFKTLLEKNGIKTFEGFDCTECVGYPDQFSADVKKILSDYDCNAHYNLHGSSFWKVLELNSQQLPNPEIVLTAYPSLAINDSPTSFQMEKGRTLMVTNIVTVYQKAQKAMITPFKQMLSAFDKDCCFANNLYIIGYSLGDEHINESIKTAIRHNADIKIFIVDPSFIANNMDLQIAMRFYPFQQSGSLSQTRVSEHVYSYLGGKIIVYTMKFEDYLTLQTDQTVQLEE